MNRLVVIAKNIQGVILGGEIQLVKTRQVKRVGVTIVQVRIELLHCQKSSRPCLCMDLRDQGKHHFRRHYVKMICLRGQTAAAQEDQASTVLQSTR